MSRQILAGACLLAAAAAPLAAQGADSLVSAPISNVRYEVRAETSSFTTTFRKHTGLTPTAYRRTLE